MSTPNDSTDVSEVKCHRRISRNPLPITTSILPGLGAFPTHKYEHHRAIGSLNQCFKGWNEGSIGFPYGKAWTRHADTRNGHTTFSVRT